MSRIPQGNYTRPKKETKESSNDTKGRLIEIFRRLEGSSDQAFPTAVQIENISNSPLAPYLLLLSEHVVGHAQATHVRRQLRDLQSSNLPSSIMGEVFPKELVLKVEHASSTAFESAKERTLYLEDECQAGRLHTIDELKGYKQRHRLLNELVSVATQTRVALEQFQQQAATVNSNASSQIIADATNTIPALISAIENPETDMGLPKIVTFDSSSNGFAPWTQLLETTCRMIEETTLPTSNQVLPEIKNAAKTISDLKRVLLDLNSSCNDEGDTSLEVQLQGAESYSNYPGREAIMELAKTNARMRILQAIHETPLVPADTLECNEGRVVDLHSRTTRLLKASQALMRETKALAVRLPEEVRGDILPTSSQIAALKNDLRGRFEARRLDAHDSVIENTQDFSRRVCETLGLPPDASPDVIYNYVRNRLSGSS